MRSANMKFDASGETIKGLLGSTRIYEIPRFQRDFSWEKYNYEELLRDLQKQIKIKIDNGRIDFKTSGYYLGNMIFLGEKDKNRVKIIDGQQRLTTGTILLAAIRENLLETNNNQAKKYADTIQKKYIAEEIDGELQRKLESSAYPYFAQTIQNETPTEMSLKEPSNREEELLKETFSSYKIELKKKKIMDLIGSSVDKQDKKLLNLTDESVYIEYLKTLRNQLLESEVIAIFVGDENEVYRIFENINSKGKPLSQVDLIKNHLFSRLTEKNSAGLDEIREKWKEINLELAKSNTSFNEFFLHYWKAIYPKDGANGKNLYQKYTKKFADDRNDSKFRKFLSDLGKSASNYCTISSPSLDEFKKQEEIPIYTALNSINRFGGIQSRIAMLALYNAEDKLDSGKIKQKRKVDFFKFLADFHFAAFGVAHINANRITGKFKNFSIQVKDAKKADDIYNAIEIMKRDLLKTISKEEFIKGFMNLTFTKENARNNLKAFPASYAINAIADMKDGRSFNSNNSTIEHIIDEASGVSSVENIGNLTVLEGNLNQKLAIKKGSSTGVDIKYKERVYKESAYKLTREIKVREFNKDTIEKRSRELADYFWDNFLLGGLEK